MANEFQKGLGKALKANGFHVEYDPDTNEKLPKGIRNPKGIKVANCNQRGRVGIIAAGEDPGEAVQFVTDRGYILERHDDGFVAVLDTKSRSSASDYASIDKLWQDQPAPRPPMGQWLIENMPRGIDLEIPDRRNNGEGADIKKHHTRWLKWKLPSWLSGRKRPDHG